MLNQTLYYTIQYFEPNTKSKGVVTSSPLGCRCHKKVGNLKVNFLRHHFLGVEPALLKFAKSVVICNRAVICQKQISVESNGHCCHRPSSNWETNQPIIV